MDEKLSALIRSMIRTERSGRSTAAAVALRDIKSDFAARGAVGHGRLPVVLDGSAASEYERRAKAYLEISKRVVNETETPWNEETTRSTQHLLSVELATDWQELLDRLRSVIGPQQQVRIDALESTKTRMDRMIEDELSLLVIRQDRGRLPLGDLLSSPRYATVLGPWHKAIDFLNANPPDLANAGKEAVSSVEALARIVVGESKLTLGESIKRLRSSGRLTSATLKGLEELWGIASESPGVRHGGSASDLDAPTARYIVDLSHAALRLLLATDA